MLKKNRAKHLRVTDQSSKEQTIAKCTDARYLLGCRVLVGRGGGALCVQMDFMRAFETTTKCNKINRV